MSTLETVGWVSLFEDIFPSDAAAPAHHAAARLVTDPHSLKEDRLHDHDVEVEVIRRRKDWKPGEEYGKTVRLPLADLWTHLERFDILEIATRLRQWQAVIATEPQVAETHDSAGTAETATMADGATTRFRTHV